MFWIKQLLSLSFGIVLLVILVPLLIIRMILALFIPALRKKNLPETKERLANFQHDGEKDELSHDEDLRGITDWTGDEQQQIVSTVNRGDDSRPSVFRGNVRFGYSSDSVKSIDNCTRCTSPTRQHYSNFIYATQIAPRVMFAPAGHFCSKCPTVIIDEGMIRVGIKKRFQYKGVLGIDTKMDGSPEFFRKWNGRDAIYPLDENENPVGIAAGEETAPESNRPAKRSRTKAKNRMQSRSRKKESTSETEEEVMSPNREGHSVNRSA